MTSLDSAGCWFLHSGIQEPSGGVARYHRFGSGNLPVSSEITGYYTSALLWLHQRTGNDAYRQAGLRGASFLLNEAWDAVASTYPFEPGSNLGYFFDVGIVARGLLAAWRTSGEVAYHERAQEAALSLAFDYLGDGCFYPVISLPDKQPLPEEPRWSRQPGCFQLKSALIWYQLDDPHARRMFEMALAYALATHESFLVATERASIMDRLHAYCYFLEALCFAGEHAEARAALAAGVTRAARFLREIAPSFERSDVWAQLLRVRLMAAHTDLLPLDTPAAQEEAARVAGFQVLDADAPAAARGGFAFGRKAGEPLPFSNPVSTAFCAQALALWDDHQAGRWTFQLPELI